MMRSLPLRSVDAFDGLGFRPGLLVRFSSSASPSSAADTARQRRTRSSTRANDSPSMGAALWEGRRSRSSNDAAPGRGSGELTPTERQIAVLVARG